MIVKTIYIAPGQTLFDIAVQEYSSVEGVFLVMLANSSVISSITDDLVPGQKLTIWPVKVIEEIVSQEESLASYMPVFQQWLAAMGGNYSQSTGGSGGSTFNDADYVHVRGDELIAGIKTVLQEMRVNKLEEAGIEGIDIEGFKFDDDILDLGTF